MHKINTLAIKVCKTVLGTKPQSSEYHIQMSNFTTSVVWCAGLERGTEKGIKQNSIQQSIAPHKHKNSKILPNNIQRSSLRLDWFNYNCD